MYFTLEKQVCGHGSSPLTSSILERESFPKWLWKPNESAVVHFTPRHKALPTGSATSHLVPGS